MIFGQEKEKRIRFEAIKQIEFIAQTYKGEVPWGILKEGFQAENQRCYFASKAIGIFKPKGFTAALSIRSSSPREGRPRPYVDQIINGGLPIDGGTGLLKYSLQKGQGATSQNKYLMKAKEQNLPLIYFYGIGESMYLPIAPIWIKEIDYSSGTGMAYLTTTPSSAHEEVSTGVREAIEQHYIWRLHKTRGHQSQFRKMIGTAYGWRCAFSALPIKSLLVGAHIIPDSEGGIPSIKNGVCMSTLHHSAFDSNLIGVDPNFRIHVSHELLTIKDGQVLENLKRLSDKKLRLPSNKEYWPEKKFLEQRFEKFKSLQLG